MDNVTFKRIALAQLREWMHEDIKTVDKIYSLIEDILRNGSAKGIGKPERLKHIDGWSRRIDNTNRLVYKIKDDQIIIDSCKDHYDD